MVIQRAAESDATFGQEILAICEELRRYGAEPLIQEVIGADGGQTSVDNDPATRPGQSDPLSGSSARPRTHCAHCGAGVPPNREFCSNCGAYLAWEHDRVVEPTPAASAPVAPPPASAQGPRDVETIGGGQRSGRRWRQRRSEQRRYRPTAPDGSGLQPGHSPATQAAVETALRIIDKGSLLFNPPQRMRQGRIERIEVAVGRTKDFDEDLRRTVRNPGTGDVEDIETSPFMAVELRGEAFEITPLHVGGGGEQVLHPTALWEFDVLPRRSGAHKLQVCVAMRIPIPNRGDERVSVPVVERDVRVSVDPRYGAKQFLRENWQWCLATLAGLGGALAAWFKLFQGG